LTFRKPYEPAYSNEVRTLKKLYTSQLAYVSQTGFAGDDMNYLMDRFEIETALQRQIRAIDMLMPYVRGKILDWGCRQGLDSCILRMRLGDSIRLRGCDIYDARTYKPFHEFSGIEYTRLLHPYRLDYSEDEFDVVLANGVLEHVPDDASSVREIYRVLKPNGVLLITCTPNKWSYTEAIARWAGIGGHERLYTVRSLGRLLSQPGFRVIHAKRFFMVPTMLTGFPTWAKKRYQRAQKPLWFLNDLVERLWPLNLLSSNLMVVARKSNVAPG
jgi:SAM-dependent methyltransferase